MKKFVLMLALALPCVLASCSDENNDPTIISLDKSAVTIDYGETTTLKASEKKAEWSSSNEFVATVDKDGKVEAKHVGQTTISATKDGVSATCVVTVNPTNNAFNTILAWGSTQQQIQSQVPTDLQLFIASPDELLYTLENEEYPWYGFIFEDGKLAGSSLYFTDQMFDDNDFNGYINQRYTSLGNEEDGKLYGNGYTRADSDIALIVNWDTEDEVWVATWQPMTHVGTKALGLSMAQRAKALYKKAKK